MAMIRDIAAIIYVRVRVNELDRRTTGRLRAGLRLQHLIDN